MCPNWLFNLHTHHGTAIDLVFRVLEEDSERHGSSIYSTSVAVVVKITYRLHVFLSLHVLDKYALMYLEF